MAMELYINDVQQTNFILSAPYKDTIDEELDQLNFQIKSSTRKYFKKNDKVRYVLKQVNSGDPITYETILDKIFCLFNYKESLDGMLWVYQITCLSPTKILENIIINGMAETYASTNLYYELVRIKNKIQGQLNLEGVGITLNFDSNKISNSNNALNVAPKEFLWDGQVNVREIFNDVFSVIDAIVVATDYTISNENITNITISYELRNKTGAIRGYVRYEEIQNGNEVIKGVSYTRDSEFTCGNIVSLIKNGVAKDNIQQVYLPARNTDLTIDDASKWCIITQEPIYSLNKVLALKPVRPNVVSYYNENMVITSKSYNDGSPIEYFYYPVDITDSIVEKSVFDAMSLSDQSQHLYFIRGQKNIYGLYDRYKSGATGLFSATALYNILINTTNSPAINNGSVWSWQDCADAPFLVGTSSDYDMQNHTSPTTTFPYIVSRDGVAHAFNITSWTANQATDNDAYKQCLFSINYQPYVDSVVKIEKPNVANIEANSKNLAIIKNQNDRTIDMTKYYNSQKAFADRMGNKEMYVDSIVNLEHMLYTSQTMGTLWNLGDYLQETTLNPLDPLHPHKWIVVQRTFELYGEDKIKINYKLSKNYNASNLDIELKRDKRLYGIPLDKFVDRYIIIKSENANSINKIAIECWDDFTGGTTTRGYCVMEAVKIGNSTITDKVARCLDNYAVDIERTKSSSTIVNIYLRYCGTDGYSSAIELRGMTNAYYSNLTIDDYTRLPFIKNSSAVYDITNNTYVLSNFNNTIYKDKMERLIFVIKQA